MIGKKINIFLWVLIFVFSVFPTAVSIGNSYNYYKDALSPNTSLAASMSPTEQSQEIGSSTIPGSGADSDLQSNIDSRGLVPCTIGECTFCHLLELLERIFYWLLSMAFVVAIFFVVFSGFVYIASIGDSGMMGWAKEGLKFSIIGFAICLLSWLGIHVIYTTLGYNGEGNWWEVKCDEKSQSLSTSENNAQKLKTASLLYANEIPPEKLGGRKNPIALPDLETKDLADIPENKYFFIHGIGGQPLESAAKQLAQITEKAQEQKKIVYAATPNKDPNSDIAGYQTIKLNDYLPVKDIATSVKEVGEQIAAQPTVSSDDLSQEAIDRFSNLALSLTLKNTSHLLPLILSQEGGKLPDFSSLWPEDPNFYAGEKTTYKTLSTLTNDGVLYTENGPLMVNWPDEKAPSNFSDFNFHVRLDPKTNKYVLDLNDPVEISLPTNISPDAARAAVRDFSTVLKKIVDQQKTYDSEEDFLSDFTTIAGGFDDSLQKESAVSEDQNVTSVGNSSGLYNNFTFDDNGEALKKTNWDNSGTGVLPSGISKTVSWPQHPDLNKLDKTTKELEKELQDWIKKDLNKKQDNFFDDNSSTSSGSGQTNGSGSSTPSGTGSTKPSSSNQESSTPLPDSLVGGTAADPNSMVSTVSVGVSRSLTLEERGKIRDMLVNIQKEEFAELQKNGQMAYLNMPPDYIMCLIQAESSFNPVATSPTGAAGLGQFTQDSQTQAAQMLKKIAPEHYQEFSKKYGQDLTQLMSAGAKGNSLSKVKQTIKKDANLAAALTYAFAEVKARNVLKINRPMSTNDLQNTTYRYIGDGNEGSQWAAIKRCMSSNGWATAAKKSK